MVAPSPGRGLKLILAQRTGEVISVAPSPGRGLKQLSLNRGLLPAPVAPSPGRGLKLFISISLAMLAESPLHRGVD